MLCNIIIYLILFGIIKYKLTVIVVIIIISAIVITRNARAYF